MFRIVEWFWDLQLIYFILRMVCYCRNVLYKVLSIWGVACSRKVTMGILLPFLFLSLVILVQAGNRMAKMKRKTKLKQNSSPSEISLIYKAFLHIRHMYLKVYPKPHNLLWRLVSVGDMKHSASYILAHANRDGDYCRELAPSCHALFKRQPGSTYPLENVTGVRLDQTMQEIYVVVMVFSTLCWPGDGHVLISKSNFHLIENLESCLYYLLWMACVILLIVLFCCNSSNKY